MAKNISTIYLNAAAEKVWDALTNPEKVKLWQYGSELITDWKAGSKISFRTAWQDKVFEQYGKVLTLQPYKLISYSLFAPRPDLEDVPENYFVMNYILTPSGENTKLEIVQEDNRPGAVQEEPQGEDNPILQMLKNVVEGKN